jgi:hypothetical protein
MPASKIGSMTIFTAACTTRSRTADSSHVFFGMLETCRRIAVRRIARSQVLMLAISRPLFVYQDRVTR